MADKLFCIKAGALKQLNAAVIGLCDILVYSPGEYTAGGVNGFLDGVKKLSAGAGKTVPVYLDLPAAAMSDDIRLLRRVIEGAGGGLAGLCANNVYGLALAKEYGLDVFKGLGLNTLNDNYCGFDNVLLSPELYEGDYRNFSGWDKRNYFLYVYGHLPLMLLSHCPYQVNGFDCKTCGGVQLKYRDELNNEMRIRRIKMANCYFELLNSVPHNLLNYKNKIKPHFFIDITENTAADALDILTAFSTPGNKPPQGKYTAGAYFKDIQ